MSKNYAKPKGPHIEWSEQELGVIIHFDISVFDPHFGIVDRNNLGKRLPLEMFNPVELNTDQWLETAQKMGAKYAVLVAKHCTGFSLWPTKAHDYHVGNTPYKKDIVADFIQSCKKYNIRPGLYCSTVFNLAFGVVEPGKVVEELGIITQQEYNRIVETQLTELWSQYGDLFEIWFDGGTLPPEQGGPNIVPLLEKYQPNAICFGGPEGHRYNVRWVWNEDGKAFYNNWSTAGAPDEPVNPEHMANGVGTPNSLLWSPAECDMPNRKLADFGGGWVCLDGDEEYLYNTSELLERFYKSAGRNGNLLLGMLINTRGLVPDADVKQFEQLGKAIRPFYEEPIASVAETGNEVLLEINGDDIIDTISISEDIRYGQRVLAYEVYIKRNGDWKMVFSARSIGNRRLIPISKTTCEAVKLVVLDSVDIPIIKQLAVYFADVEKHFDPAVCTTPGVF